MKVYTTFNASKNKNYYKQPFYKSTRFYVIFFLILLVALFIFWSATKNSNNDDTQISLLDEQPEQIPVATIDYLQGSMKIKIDENWQDINNNSKLEPGSHLKTDTESKAIIAFPDGSLLRLDENSEVILKKFSIADITIEQISGRAFNRVVEGTPAIYRVIHNNTEFTALGTGFNITIENDLLKLFVSESRVKVKVYEENDLLNIRNMRTIDQGYYAVIDTTQTDNDKIITSEQVDLSDLNNNDWLNWNKDKDDELNFYLGVYAENISLDITSPDKLEIETDQDTYEIIGQTDPEAEIFIDGNEVDNNNGKFSFKINLEAGENIIEVSVLKDRQKNKKTFSITSTKDKQGSLTVSITQQDNEISLTWTLENQEAPFGFRTVMSTTSSPAYPDNKSHDIPADTFTDTWKNVEDGTYYFRVCIYDNQQCTLYSPDAKITLKDEDSDATDKTIPENAQIILSATADQNNANLSWTTQNLTNIDNLRVLIDTKENPTYPTSSGHVVSNNSTTDTWDNLNPGIYHFRVCAFLDNKCQLYSNNYSLKIEEETPLAKISLSGSNNNTTVNLSWTTENIQSSKGFLALIDKNSRPDYPSSTAQTLSSSEANSTSWTDLEIGGNYHFLVCENTGNDCGITSNEVIITIK